MLSLLPATPRRSRYLQLELVALQRHVVLFRTTLVAVTSDGDRSCIVTFEAFSHGCEFCGFTTLDVGPVVVEVDWVAATLNDLDLADATYTFLTLGAGRCNGVIATLGSWVTASAVAEVLGGALFVVETFVTALVLSTFLLTGASSLFIAVSRNLLAAACGALHSGTLSLTVRVISALLTLCLKTVFALVGAVVIIFALWVGWPTGGHD